MVFIEALDWALGWLDSCSFLRDWSLVLAIVFLLISGVYYGYNLSYIRDNEDKKQTADVRRQNL